MRLGPVSSINRKIILSRLGTHRAFSFGRIISELPLGNLVSRARDSCIIAATHTRGNTNFRGVRKEARRTAFRVEVVFAKSSSALPNNHTMRFSVFSCDAFRKILMIANPANENGLNGLKFFSNAINGLKNCISYSKFWIEQYSQLYLSARKS